MLHHNRSSARRRGRTPGSLTATGRKPDAPQGKLPQVTVTRARGREGRPPNARAGPRVYPRHGIDDTIPAWPPPVHRNTAPPSRTGGLRSTTGPPRPRAIGEIVELAHPGLPESLRPVLLGPGQPQ